MPRKPLELQPTVARTYVRDMRAYFAVPESLSELVRC